MVRRVRDVAAHVSLVGLPPSPGTLPVDLIRARGSLHQLNTMASLRRAERAPEQLIADLRQHAGSRKVPIVSNQRNILFDVLVHVQDIAMPLGIDLPMPVAAAAAGAARVWSMGWPFWARRQLRGLLLRATDTDWSAQRGRRTAGTDRNALAAIDRAHNGSASTAVRARRADAHRCSVIPRAEADQS